MLEIERESKEVTDGSAEAGEDNGGQGRKLLRRARRTVSRPAGPPDADAGIAAGPPGGQSGDAAHGPADSAQPAGGRPDAAAGVAGGQSGGPAAGGTADGGSPAAAGAVAAGAGVPATSGRSRSRARSAAKPPAAEQAAPTEQAQPAETAQAPAEAAVLPDGAEAAPPPKRRRTRQSAGAASAASSGQSAGADQASGASQSGGAGQSGAGPAASAGQPAGGSQVASSAGQEGGGEAGAPAVAVPAATFQPPVVIFQPPAIDAVSPPASGGSRRRQDAPDPGEAVTDSAGDRAGADRPAGDQEDDGEAGPRRRRRGGRGHGKGRSGADDAADGSAQSADQQAESRDAASGPDPAAADSEGDDAAGPRRRRRRRRSGSGAETGEVTPDDPPNTVVHVRPSRAAAAVTDVTDVRGVRGSTRLEAKRQRRREGRETGRRRPPIITESEYLARREAVQRLMVVRQRGDRTQIAVLEDGVLVEHYVDKASHQSYVGNVYLGKVQNVLPSMEAAFVDIGKGRNAVLYAGEVNFDASGLEGESKRIESALKSGQSILVQVTKDPIGHKGARLTSQVSLPGRYLVYVPGASMTGISRKLPDTERARLKQILKQVMPEGAGVIVRTAAEGASEEELARDVARLAAQWEAIERKAKTATAPDLLSSEPDLTIRVVRDIFNEDFGKLVIASDNEWDMVDEYVRYVAPHLAERMERWEEDGDVFAAYRIDEQLAKALERKVWLPSGGSLVIDNTEAMTVIDVNTGKFTGQGGNLEQTVTRNNLEAAEEIVRQLRLRDVGGIIVIDFIDMVLESNRELVLRRLLECLARDRTKHQVAEVTSLGLVQMTRKRVGSGLLEAFSTTCECCNGRGVIVSMEPVDHTPSPGRGRGDDDGHRDDGKARGGRGSRGGRQAKGDGSRGGSGRDGSARPDGAGATGTGADVLDSGDGERSVGTLVSSGDPAGGGLTASAATAVMVSGTLSGGTTAPAEAAGPGADSALAGSGGSRRSGRGRGRAVRSAGPAALDLVASDSLTQDSAAPADSPAASSPAPGPAPDNGAHPAGSEVGAPSDAGTGGSDGSAQPGDGEHADNGVVAPAAAGRRRRRPRAQPGPGEAATDSAIVGDGGTTTPVA
ncbi:MAG TPA: Rne/Rng family ribonuclease [Streptosporangiaceae bacterium]